MNTQSQPDRRRAVRSFVLRKGRLTPGQARALEELWPRFGIPASGGLIKPAELFGREAPLVVEIGFGNGEATWRMAAAEPGTDFIGIEVHPPGIGHLLLALDRNDVPNVRVARADAVTFLHERLGPDVVDEVRIYFPDPWPKKRHHKRRLIQPAFAALLARRIREGGIVHVASDWPEYVAHIEEVMAAEPSFAMTLKAQDDASRPNWRPRTKYQRRGERLGHPVTDLVYKRVSATGASA
ncbi:MAG: tRNA (guanosine(46)-N7)-methyltransferase TrmB [Xanthomonadales bacterium]|nr:tRNA (guanosine(46)-N7)-methyltransferase TrmB [Xanthomonadales bacterium]